MPITPKQEADTRPVEEKLAEVLKKMSTPSKVHLPKGEEAQAVDVEEGSRADRLATVLRKMSKPSRPDDASAPQVAEAIMDETVKAMLAGENEINRGQTQAVKDLLKPRRNETPEQASERSRRWVVFDNAMELVRCAIAETKTAEAKGTSIDTERASRILERLKEQTAIEQSEAAFGSVLNKLKAWSEENGPQGGPDGGGDPEL